jgi:hypothetical protein
MENKMDVRIIPLNGCMQVFLGVFTLGVAPLAIWISERSWPKSVDEQGLTTRGGKQIAWNEFTKVTRVLTRVTRGSSSTVEHFELRSSKGKVVVAAYRLVDGEQVLDYIWRHLPEQAKQG